VTQPLPPVALYVHMPFCAARCPYCDFVVYAGADARGPRARTGRLYDALARELELRTGFVAAEPAQVTPPAGTANAAPPLPLQSIYFGGGTPSLAPAEVIERLIGIAASRWGIAPGAEITLEMNPGPDERGDLAAFARAGVNRVSIGAQSLDPGELRRIGRRHSPADVAAAVVEAREAGIRSVNLDLLYDIPGQSLAAWAATLRAALELRPDHLSLYALTLDDPESEGLTGDRGDHLATPPGARRWRERAREEQDDDRAADQYALALELLASLGWRGYEISNWSRPGHESRHNLAYWLRLPYEAVGPGAHAFDGITRRWNSAAMEPYIAALAAESLPPGSWEHLDERAAAAETAILSLRLDTGIPAAWAERAATAVAATDPVAPTRAAAAGELPLAEVVAWGLETGLLERVELDGEARLRLTLRGRLLSNELFSRLV
jgi:oxygen-independent coproporphyrinogen III oxidase